MYELYMGPKPLKGKGRIRKSKTWNRNSAEIQNPAETETLAETSETPAETVQNYPKLSSILALNFRLSDGFK